MPREAIPDPVTASLDVQVTCAVEAACGGDLDDTDWAYSQICLDRDQIFDAVYAQCPTSQLNGEGDVSITGSLTFAGGMATHTATITGTGVFKVPNECHACDCKGMQEIFLENGAPVNTFCYEDCEPDLSCRCLVDFEVEISEQASYEVAGNTLTLGSGAQYDYCASSSSLSLGPQGANPALPGTVTLIPFERTKTPEICDGVDNDKNGVIDDDPAECPTVECLTRGVCAGVVQRCSNAWYCDYGDVPREAGEETICDGLDNDCDGEVDDGLVGCVEICDGLDNDNDGTIDDSPEGSPCSALLGVCASGITSACLGEEGWRCGAVSQAYESGEASCDALDNDCDGLVDEGCSCATGTSKMFVVDWGGMPQLLQADLDGGNAAPVALLSGAALTKVAVDSKTNKLYYGDANNQILRANLDGSSPEVLWTGQSQTWDIDISTRILLGECNTSNVCRLTLPTGYGTLVQSAAVAGLDIDPVNRAVYWSDHGSTFTHSILRANLDGSNVTGIFESAFSPLTLEVDPAGQKIYWPDANGIHEMGLDGSNEQLFLSLPSSYTYDMEIDDKGGKLYFTDVNAKEVRRVNLDGTGYEPLLDNLGYPVSIALYVCAP